MFLLLNSYTGIVKNATADLTILEITNKENIKYSILLSKKSSVMQTDSSGRQIFNFNSGENVSQADIDAVVSTLEVK